MYIYICMYVYSMLHIYICTYIVGWLFRFHGISTNVGYLIPNPFLYKYFYFKQFSLFKLF